MNPADYSGQSGSMPWQRYIAAEHAARDAYLQTTRAATAEYLTGPWPDRDAYSAVERSAWTTYYAAGRNAWRVYRSEITPPPPPPALPAEQFPAAAQLEQDQVSRRYWSSQPTFTEHPGGTE